MSKRMHVAPYLASQITWRQMLQDIDPLMKALESSTTPVRDGMRLGWRTVPLEHERVVERKRMVDLAAGQSLTSQHGYEAPSNPDESDSESIRARSSVTSNLEVVECQHTSAGHNHTHQTCFSTATLIDVGAEPIQVSSSAAAVCTTLSPATHERTHASSMRTDDLSDSDVEEATSVSLSQLVDTLRPYAHQISLMRGGLLSDLSQGQAFK